MTSADPIGFEGGLNLYTGMGNNPVNYVDPEGLKPPSGPLGYVVEVVGKGLELISGPLGFEDLVEHARDGDDILCKNQKTAKIVAETAGGGPAIGPERHRPRNPRSGGPGSSGRSYRGHYHLAGRSGGHIFFSLAIVLSFKKVAKAEPCERVQVAAEEGFDYLKWSAIYAAAARAHVLYGPAAVTAYGGGSWFVDAVNSSPDRQMYYDHFLSL